MVERHFRYDPFDATGSHHETVSIYRENETKDS